MKWKVYAAAAGSVVVVLAIAATLFAVWLRSHDREVAEQAVVKAETQRLREERDSLRQQLAEALKPIEEDRKITQPVQIIERIVQQPSVLPYRVDTSPPDAPPQITITGTEIPKFWQANNDCRECQVRLASRDKEVANLERQVTTLERRTRRHWYQSPKLWFTIGAIGGGYAAHKLGGD